MDSSIIDSYKSDGYVVVKGLLDPELLDQQLKNIYKILRRFHKPSHILEDIKEPWKNMLLHEEIINFRQTDPKLFSGFYDSLQSSVALTRIVSSKKLLDCAAGLLELEACELSSNEQASRVDVPFDTRNSLDWHQDISYFRRNVHGLKCVSCWLPLVEMTEETGFLEVCVKSHLDGLASGFTNKWIENKGQEKKDFDESDFLTTETVSIKDDVNIDKYKVERVKTSTGDVLFFNMFLIHRSGRNESKKIRFSCQNRFHGATSPDFLPFRTRPQNNPFMQKLIESGGC